MGYYYISVAVCWTLLNVIGICIYPPICAISGIPLAIMSVCLLNLLVLIVWVVTVAHFDLDHRDANYVDMEREKFKAIHEYRRLHEVDHLDFTQSLYETIIMNNYPQDPNQGIQNEKQTKKP